MFDILYIILFLEEPVVVALRVSIFSCLLKNARLPKSVSSACVLSLLNCQCVVTALVFLHSRFSFFVSAYIIMLPNQTKFFTDFSTCLHITGNYHVN